MRVVGVDLGARRIGVAVSDGTGTLATPRCTIERSAGGGGDDGGHWQALAALVEEVGARRVVVWACRSASTVGAARRPGLRRPMPTRLAAVLAPSGVTVETFDERLTTVSAARSLVEGGRRGRDRRTRIDAAAAAVMLQAWLDTRGGGRHA